jgi:hypothetical protein
MTKIYTASSWRNKHYPAVVAAMRAAGFEVFDFRSANGGFCWPCATLPEYIRALEGDAQVTAAFQRDKRAIDWADALVLIRPCGISSHLEAMYASAAGKPVIVLFDSAEPFAAEKCELMYKLLAVGAGGVHFVVDTDEMLAVLRKHELLTALRKQNVVVKPGLAEYVLKRTRNNVAGAIKFLDELGVPFADACAAVEDAIGLDEAPPSQCENSSETL